MPLWITLLSSACVWLHALGCLTMLTITIIVSAMTTPAPPLPPSSVPPSLASALPEAARVFDSEQLLGGQTEIYISHQGELYRLRQTRQGKLILTK